MNDENVDVDRFNIMCQLGNMSPIYCSMRDLSMSSSRVMIVYGNFTEGSTIVLRVEYNPELCNGTFVDGQLTGNINLMITLL